MKLWPEADPLRRKGPPTEGVRYELLAGLESKRQAKRFQQISIFIGVLIGARLAAERVSPRAWVAMMLAYVAIAILYPWWQLRRPIGPRRLLVLTDQAVWFPVFGEYWRGVLWQDVEAFLVESIPKRGLFARIKVRGSKRVFGAPVQVLSADELREAVARHWPLHLHEDRWKGEK